ncbi:MAG: hypothetical protein GWM98_02500 [Nitrospinaceae bacterium]|nr:hypothetical protein [Nitrospinaceae bacterium]NIR53575.1 hypothetical protein [Nitrospinaceae bacterium]NIS83976.1 hypothetical protein [Nitrospinaceae bacterium]NIT80785.1 hypothetical protein [Nitrospinaceae bacterium]NIU43091.1 hypothetical protein [Nitrospinaceae bacterium]
MSAEREHLKEEVLRLYREPIVGANYTNTYGEENLVNLVNKYRSLAPGDQDFMKGLVIDYSQSPDLASSYVSVGVLHALSMDDQVQNAYRWAETQENSRQITHHFDIGKSLADHFISD